MYFDKIIETKTSWLAAVEMIPIIQKERIESTTGIKEKRRM